MKNLFTINEEEKNRILNLHETATKRYYLSEQSVIGAPNYGVINTTPNNKKKTKTKTKIVKPESTFKDKVIDVQNALIQKGFYVGKTGADGKLGVNTTDAIKKFQKSKNISDDGIVGPTTAKLLSVQPLTSTTEKINEPKKVNTDGLKKKIGEFSQRTQEQLKSIQSKGQLKDDSFIIVNKSAALASLFGPSYKFITNSAITSGKIKDTGVENKVDNSQENWMKISLDYAKKNPTSTDGMKINDWLKKYKDKIALIKSDGSVNWLTYLGMSVAETIDEFPFSYEARTKSGLDITPSGVFGISSGLKTKGYAGENEGENSFPLIQPDSVGEITPAIHGFASEKRGKLIDKATGQPFDVDKDYTRAGAGCINVTPNFLTKMREVKPSYVIILPDSGGIVDIKLTTFENFKIKLTQLGSKCIRSISSLFS